MKIFSGVRPTGEIHIGNYLGSVKQWVELQKSNECNFAIMDWHAITTPYDPKTLQDKIFNLAATYLSAGIDPDKCAFFIQSQVKEHAELAWLLGTIVPVGELQRMTQFKDKSKEHKEYVNAGLLNYPILMAADILLYKAEGVPVGKDQKQHVEFTRNLAEKFNKSYGKTFPLPKPLIPQKQAKIMSLKDPSKKMSKSGDQKGCITLFEDKESIRKKIISSTTDLEKEIKFDEENKKGISNLLSIYSAFSDKSIKDLEKEYKGKNYAEFKEDLADVLILELNKFKEKR
ncbi:MAG: tryptophan--tRNA ligase, partial [Candidatus Pacebacteria bacterium]|nr:tryptophan--tRNA ligase [Candidatus Paceibacterota bacterium]